MFALTTFGIGAGMHRLFVHRSFRTGPIMRVFFCAIAQMAMQGSIAKWVANHRRHHLYADDVGDPHSPQFDGFGNRYVSALKGFLHAQGSWVFDQATTDNEYYAKDILADPIAMFFVRTRWVWYGMSAVFIPGVIGYTFGGVHAMIGCVLFSGLLRCLSADPHQPAHRLGLPRLRLSPLRGRGRLDQRVRDHDPHLRRGPAQQPSPLPAGRLYLARLVGDRSQRPDHSGHGEDRPRPRRLPRLAPSARAGVRSGGEAASTGR